MATSFSVVCHGPGGIAVRCVDPRGTQQGPITLLGPEEKAQIDFDGDKGTIEIDELPPQ